MMEEEPTNEFSGPPMEESGEVDVSLIEECLRLTPAQRLDQAERFAEFARAAWRAQGIEWLATELSSKP